ncbi:hypothetical protein SAMN04488693_12920 [Arthrobacter subterraneus]|uniref:Uncharacterized protein n=1 Tax=Arthrobacter subterraneus TaxID=335973 RepID=A0A1G8P5Q5_9MICC|nr:hypothetical protein SAMN04488693_12920 [Arthrobacter subterraneus]
MKLKRKPKNLWGPANFLINVFRLVLTLIEKCGDQ